MLARETKRRFTQLSRLLTPNAEVHVVAFVKQGCNAPAALLETRKYLQAHGIEPEINFVEAAPRTGVLDHAEQWKAGMIVMGNSAKNLLRR